LFADAGHKDLKFEIRIPKQIRNTKKQPRLRFVS